MTAAGQTAVAVCRSTTSACPLALLHVGEGLGAGEGAGLGGQDFPGFETCHFGTPAPGWRRPAEPRTPGWLWGLVPVRPVTRER